MGEVEILQPGLFTTIQDLGRYSYREFGVPISGAMDMYALKKANLLLQNRMDAAVMESTLMGPRLRFSAPVKIALCGAEFSMKLNAAPVSNNEVIKVNAGDELSFGVARLGSRIYLAVAGGFQTEKVLGSRSWYRGLSNYERLEKKLKLPYYSSEEKLAQTHASVKFHSAYLNSEEIEAYPGPEFEKLKENLKQVLQEKKFNIDKSSNRMAVQMEQLIENELQPILTGPVLPGTVQLTPGGKLIILARDCQTTGGYPRVLQLSEHGMNILGQKKPGDNIRFHLLKT